MTRKGKLLIFIDRRGLAEQSCRIFMRIRHDLHTSVYQPLAVAPLQAYADSCFLEYWQEFASKKCKLLPVI